MKVSQEQINEIYSAEVVTQDDENLGSVGHVYLDDRTGEPSWITVKTGWFGTRQSLVPLDGAELTQDGKVRVVPTKETIKDAPNVDADAHLSAEDQDELFRYYGDAGVDVSRYGDRTASPGGGHDRESGAVPQTSADAGRTAQEGERGQRTDRDAAVQDVLSHPGVHAEGHPTAAGTAAGADRSGDERDDVAQQTDEEMLGADDLSDDRMIGDDSQRATPEGRERMGLRRHELPQHSGPQN